MSVIQPVQPAPVDWPALVDAWRKAWVEAGESLSRTFTQMFRGLRAIARAMRESANTEVHVAGMSARYYVRAGLDPTYRSPEALTALVRSIMGGHEAELVFVSLENRALIAAAAMVSWDHSYGEGPPGPVAWHRLLGQTTFTIGCGA